MATLISTNKLLTDKLVTALDSIAELTKLLANFKGEGSRDSNKQRCYFWTHGCRCNHNSKQCRFKVDRHIDNATATNKLGGNTKILKYSIAAWNIADTKLNTQYVSNNLQNGIPTIFSICIILRLRRRRFRRKRKFHYSKHPLLK